MQEERAAYKIKKATAVAEAARGAFQAAATAEVRVQVVKLTKQLAESEKLAEKLKKQVPSDGRSVIDTTEYYRLKGQNANLRERLAQIKIVNTTTAQVEESETWKQMLKQSAAGEAVSYSSLGVELWRLWREIQDVVCRVYRRLRS